jgi:hypothetical protein
MLKLLEFFLENKKLLKKKKKSRFIKIFLKGVNMSKKAKVKRKDAYKAFLNGMVSYREKFINKKCALIEKVLTNDSLKNTLFSKERASLSILERAVVDTINTKNINTVEDFEAISAPFKENQNKIAKFKYTPKKI